MFNVYLPINLNDSITKENVLEMLKKTDAKSAVLAFDHLILSAEREKYENTFSVIKEIIPFLKSHGYKVGVWFWSLWLTGIEREELISSVMISSRGEPRVANTALNSNEKCFSGYLCPTSSKIQAMFDIIRCVAEYRPDFILLNDDFGYATYLNSIGCYCDRHMALIREKLGYEITREELRQAVSFGKKNEIRDTWLEINGHVLEEYAVRVRETIDSVDPTIRCGFCAVMSNWSADGVSVEKISKLMAGGTRPMIRLIGAPYWSTSKAWGNRLQHTVELERMEAAWIEDKDIELISEGDVYPRPRHRVPASILEHYDTALRAAGCLDGTLKIMLGSTYSLKHEQGYVERHIENAGLYSQIAEAFDSKTALGVRVYETMNKAAFADFTDIDDPEKYAANSFFSYAARLLVDNSIPTVYTGNSGVGIAFGENARYLPKDAFDGGLILDIRAARILMEQGIDVGIEFVGDVMLNNVLYFPADDEKVLAHYRKRAAFEIKAKDGAEVITYSLNGDKRFADTVLYENANGQRFLVYAFDAAFVDENRYRNYCMQNQLVDAIEWLSGKKLPAVCLGNPDLYMICKGNDESLAIGLWNMFADDIPKPIIKLSENYRSAEFIGCDGELEGDVIRLSKIYPYGYAFVELKK